MKIRDTLFIRIDEIQPYTGIMTFIAADGTELESHSISFDTDAGTGFAIRHFRKMRQLDREKELK